MQKLVHIILINIEERTSWFLEVTSQCFNVELELLRLGRRLVEIKDIASSGQLKVWVTLK